MSDVEFKCKNGHPLFAVVEEHTEVDYHQVNGRDFWEADRLGPTGELKTLIYCRQQSCNQNIDERIQREAKRTALEMYSRR